MSKSRKLLLHSINQHKNSFRVFPVKSGSLLKQYFILESTSLTRTCECISSPTVWVRVNGSSVSSVGRIKHCVRNVSCASSNAREVVPRLAGAWWLLANSGGGSDICWCSGQSGWTVGLGSPGLCCRASPSAKEKFCYKLSILIIINLSLFLWK